MTMRELLTHSAGLGYVLNQANAVDRQIIKEQTLNAAAPLQTMIDKLAKTPLLAQPGTRWYYSIGVDVQGYLVEKMSGQPFAEFLKTRLFDPLGMKDTAFYVPKEKLGRLARLHRDGPDGKSTQPEGNPDESTVVPLGPSGGGGLYSTPDDYLRFAQMLAQRRRVRRQAVPLAAHGADAAHESSPGRRAQDRSRRAPAGGSDRAS